MLLHTLPCPLCQHTGWLAEENKFCDCDFGDALMTYLTNPVIWAYFKAYPYLAANAGISRSMLDEAERLRKEKWPR